MPWSSGPAQGGFAVYRSTHDFQPSCASPRADYRGKRYNFPLSQESSSTFGSVLWRDLPHRQFPEIVFTSLKDFKMNKTLILAAVIAAAALAACGKKEEAAAPAAPAPAAAPATEASADASAAAPAADASAAAPAADASAAK